jgi:hypothetical protein
VVYIYCIVEIQVVEVQNVEKCRKFRIYVPSPLQPLA